LAEVVLVMGRTAKQGAGVNIGKDSPEYRAATEYVELSATDAAAAGLTDGAPVTLVSNFGQTVAHCRIRPDDELPPGVAFMPYSPRANRLVGPETHGTGMPESKGLRVRLIGEVRFE
jgi:formylmethanofuran dehydrogenase subunit D